MIDRRGDLEAHQLVAVEVDGEALAGCELNGTEIGLDQAIVPDMGPGENDRAAACGPDLSFIDDRGAAGARKTIIAREEVLIADVGGRRDESTNIDLRTLAEEHAVRVDDPDLAVGLQRAVELGGPGATNPVERDRAAVGLLENHTEAARGREARPFKDGLVGRLPDERGGRVGGADAALARRDGKSGGLRRCRVARWARGHETSGGQQKFPP